MQCVIKNGSEDQVTCQYASAESKSEMMIYVHSFRDYSHWLLQVFTPFYSLLQAHHSSARDSIDNIITRKLNVIPTCKSQTLYLATSCLSYVIAAWSDKRQKKVYQKVSLLKLNQSRLYTHMKRMTAGQCIWWGLDDSCCILPVNIRYRLYLCWLYIVIYNHQMLKWLSDLTVYTVRLYLHTNGLMVNLRYC